MFDTSDLASAEIADLILENYEEAVKKYDLSWKRIKLSAEVAHLAD